MIRRGLILTYAVGGYLVAIAASLGFAAFLTGIGLPKSVDTGGSTGSTPVAVLLDVFLVLGFGLQH